MTSTANRDNCRVKFGQLSVIILSILLVGAHVLRLFDNNFWGDEAYTIRMVGMTVPEMIMETAGDVHPPLYYAMIQLFSTILGQHYVVYHLVSLVPYILVVVLALTVIKRWFGTEAGLILVLLASLLDTAVTYNVEVRMYSWGALFLLSSYLALYRIFTQNKKRDYVIFILCSLAGAYTHYYCLISVAFFYVVLIGLALIKRKEYLKRTIVTCCVTVAAYLPWFIVLLSTVKRTMGGDFWMSNIPYLKDCVAYLFQCKISYLLLVLMFVFVALTMWYKRKEGKTLLWILTGLFSIFGTILVGNVVSKVFRPVLILRYLYPVSIIAWMLLAVGIAGCKKKKLYAGIVAIVILVTGIPSFIQTYQEETAQNQVLLETLEATKEANGEGNKILTDLQYIDWMVAEYYYPDTECEYVDFAEVDMLKKDQTYWFMTRNEMTDEILTLYNKQGFEIKKIVTEGSLGTNPIIIYKGYFVE